MWNMYISFFKTNLFEHVHTLNMNNSGQNAYSYKKETVI